MKDFLNISSNGAARAVQSQQQNRKIGGKVSNNFIPAT